MPARSPARAGTARCSSAFATTERANESARSAKLRCAVYTRKSSEEGLEKEFNSLDAQREACEAYIASQKPEGWVLVADRYDDGGFSGGTLERPALQRLLRDIEAGVIDVVVVYKIDRLSRSLMDFAKLVEVFDQHNVTFVCVTQQFNTTTSMGRLTLNILLSFAQFEREVIGERIRDKFAASRRKGMWMGGTAAARLRRARPQAGRRRDRGRAGAHDLRALPAASARRPSWRRSCARRRDHEVAGRRRTASTAGQPIDKGDIYKMLNNRVYLGEAVHKGDGLSRRAQAIIDRELWDKVHAILAESPGSARQRHPRADAGAAARA